MRAYTLLPALGATLLLAMSAHPTLAQQASTPPPAAVVDQPLAIPLPPKATVQIEMDVRDDDLLGVFKSLLKGVGQAANSIPASTLSMPGGGRTLQASEMAAILSNADLSVILKDVTHVHFVFMQAPSAPSATPAAAAAGPAVPYPDQTAFYETAYAGEGGHRLLYANTDPVHLLMISFGHARGFAFVVQSPGMVAALRADGYPDLSKLAALATQIGAAVGKAAMTGPGPSAPPPSSHP